MDSSGDLMAKFEFEGVDNYIAQLEKLYDKTDSVIGETVYKGAGTVMKYVSAAVSEIVTDNRHGTPDHKVIGPTTYQKEGLIRSLGISPARYDGTFFNVKIGFDGYNDLPTKSWPQGQPNSLIARSIESGTSWMQKQPFMRKAEQAAKAPCEKVMADTVDKAIQNIMK